MSGGKSSGIDTIDSYSLKLAAPYIKEVILHLINLSITTNTFSKHWKVQLIHPFYKKGDRTKGENYRPVSHLVELSKLQEYVIFDQVMEHFISNGLFHTNHHGFLPKHSCATALIQLYDVWIKAAENQELTAALLLDLSAAFDLVCHKILLKKLELYKFDKNALEFFKSYLSARKQRVQVESKISECRDIGEIAVPQGSVLGGLFFIIFQNDFPANAESGESILYADDDTDNVHDDDPDALQNKIQIKANKSTEWITDNRMVFSGEKTKLIIVGTKDLRQRKLIDQNIELNVKVGENIVYLYI